MGGKNLLGASSVKAPKDDDASDDDIKVARLIQTSHNKSPFSTSPQNFQQQNS